MEAGKGGEGEGGDESAANLGIGWKGKIEGQWRKLRLHAETYPYVWASYIVVYGGFGIYLTYRWRKLRRTESRVRVLHERLRKLVEEEEAAAAASSGGSGAAKVTPTTLNSVPVPVKKEEKMS